MATIQSALTQELDPQKRSSASRHFEEELRQRVVGQDEAVEALVDLQVQRLIFPSRVWDS